MQEWNLKPEKRKNKQSKWSVIKQDCCNKGVGTGEGMASNVFFEVAVFEVGASLKGMSGQSRLKSDICITKKRKSKCQDLYCNMIRLSVYWSSLFNSVLQLSEKIFYISIVIFIPKYFLMEPLKSLDHFEFLTCFNYGLVRGSSLWVLINFTSQIFLELAFSSSSLLPTAQIWDLIYYLDYYSTYLTDLPIFSVVPFKFTFHITTRVIYLKFNSRL